MCVCVWGMCGAGGVESVECGWLWCGVGVVVGVRGWAPTDVGVGWKCVSLAGELTTTLFLEQLHHVSSLQCQDSVVSWGCEQCREEGFVTSSYSFPQHLCSANPLVFAKNTSSCDGMWQIESPVFIVRFFVRLKIIFHLGSSWVAKTLCMLRNCFFASFFALSLSTIIKIIVPQLLSRSTYIAGVGVHAT